MNYGDITGRKSIRSSCGGSESPPSKSKQQNQKREKSPSSGESSESEVEEFQTANNTSIQRNSVVEHSEESYEFTNAKCSLSATRHRTQKRLSRDNTYQEESYTNSNDSTAGATASILFWIASVLMGLIAIVYFMNSHIGTTATNLRIKCSFDSLKNEFPSEKELLWKALKVGTESILNNDPAVPGVYLFLHSNSSLPKNLIWNIAKTAAACFDPELEPMELSNKDFTSEETIKDYGVVIEKYKRKIKQGGALIVANLNEIPGEAARALHAICDTYNPIVRKVVIFMTLVTPKEQLGNEIEIAENTLFRLWGSSLKRSDLDPLITRVTDQVFKIRTT